MATIVEIKAEEVGTVLAKIPHSAIMTVKFEKKDHSIRTMNCRRGVKKYISATPTRPRVLSDSVKQELVTVFDMHKHEYRSFNKSSVLEIRADHHRYVVVD